jgi:nitrate reductase gamma subunit
MPSNDTKVGRVTDATAAIISMVALVIRRVTTKNVRKTNFLIYSTNSLRL